MKWSLQRVLGLSNEELEVAEKQAARLENKYRPDGATEYIPVSEAGAVFQEKNRVHPLVFQGLRAAALGLEIPVLDFTEEEP